MSEKNQRRQASADIARANQARELLDNPLYIEAVTVMRAAMYGEFEDSKLADENIRHVLWQRMQLMKAFQGKFEDIVKRGKRAEGTINLLGSNEP